MEPPLRAMPIVVREHVIAAAMGLAVVFVPISLLQTISEVEIEGGDDAAQELLSGLIHAGMPVARFERVVAPLGELIDRAIGRSNRR